MAETNNFVDNVAQQKSELEAQKLEGANPDMPQLIDQQLFTTGGAQPISEGDTTPMTTITDPSKDDSVVNPEGIRNVQTDSTTENLAQQNTIEQQAKEGELATQALTEGIQQQIDAQKNLADQTQQRIDEDKAAALEDKTREEAFAEGQKGIIKAVDKRQSEIEKEMIERADARAERDVELLRKEQEAVKSRQQAEIEVAEQARALQIQKDNNALKKAERDIEVAHQKANWAFNKLGLMFSSGALLQTQQIATQGANKLAELKIQANFNQAKISLEIAKLNEDINKTQLEYTKQINGTIDKYSDISLQVEKDATDRIAQVKSNLLLTNKEKNDKIAEILSELRTNIRTTEDDFRTEQERLTNDVINKSDKLEEKYKEYAEEKKVEINGQIISGDIFQKTPEELTQMEVDAGLIPGSINSMISSKVETSLRSMYDSIIGPDYNINNINSLKADVLDRMKQGQTLIGALSGAVQGDLDTNDRYAQIEKARELEIKAAEADIARTNALTSATSSKASASDEFTKRLKVGDITEEEFKSQIGTDSPNSVISNLQSRGLKTDQIIGLTSRFFNIPLSSEGLSDNDYYFTKSGKLKQVDTYGFDETIIDLSK